LRQLRHRDAATISPRSKLPPAVVADARVTAGCHIAPNRFSSSAPIADRCASHGDAPVDLPNGWGL